MFWLYGLFATQIEQGYFTEGKLYWVKRDASGFKMFFKTTLTGNIFSCAVRIPVNAPLIYLGVQEQIGANFHIFLYGDMKVYTFGLLNSNPSTYWEEARPSDSNEPQHVV